MFGLEESQRINASDNPRGEVATTRGVFDPPVRPKRIKTRWQFAAYTILPRIVANPANRAKGESA